MTFSYFRTKKGRPKSTSPMIDSGTPELLAKHKKGHTAEPLDKCLKRGLINITEHRAGMHLRWLYTVCVGIPTPKTLNPTAEIGRSTKSANDSNWLQKQNQKYKESLAVLEKAHALDSVLNCCVFMQHPAFLLPKKILHAKKTAIQETIKHEQSVFQTGLNNLCKYWGL